MSVTFVMAMKVSAISTAQYSSDASCMAPDTVVTAVGRYQRVAPSMTVGWEHEFVIPGPVHA